MGMGAARRCSKRLLDQFLRALNISGPSIGLPTKDAGREYMRYPRLRLHGLRIERQRLLEQADRVRIIIAYRPLIVCGTPAQDIVESVGMLNWTLRLRSN